MWIRCGWMLHGRLSAGRIQARRTRAVFEREPVALQLGDSQVGRSLRVEVAYVRQLESPWIWPEQELSNCSHPFSEHTLWVLLPVSIEVFVGCPRPTDAVGYTLAVARMRKRGSWLRWQGGAGWLWFRWWSNRPRAGS